MSENIPAQEDPRPDEPLGPGTQAGDALPDTESPRRGIKSLTDEQIRTWTLRQKDEWWLKNVFRGDMPQLTVRSGITGMLLGGILSLTNLYVGAKTGWTLGVGITSVILAFAAFRVMHGLHLVKREYTILENNAMQSIATAAGYMTGSLVSSVAAYMMVTGKIIPVGITIVWVIAISVLGVLFAFPLKRRFINDEQLPFPEGRAAGIVMESLHTGDAKEGLFKAKLLAITAAGSAFLKVLQSHPIMEKLHLGFLAVPEYVDGWLHNWLEPKIMGTPLKSITVRADTDFVMMAAGGLMGIYTGVSLLVGACVNYLILVPWMIQRGDITGHLVDGAMAYSFKDITFWALWCGVAMMTTSSLLSFLSKPKVLLSAFSRLFRRRAKGGDEDPVAHIELPLKVFIIGIPIVGLVVVILAHIFFDVSMLMGILAVPLVFVFSLIAVNSTGLTSITPTGALGKLTQITYGAIAPGNITTNLMTAGITAEVASNASNLLMDIKPGYMLGGKPRHQAVGHLLGILAGSVAAVPVFYLVFVRGNPSGIVSSEYPFPSATVWKAVAEVLTTGLSNLEYSAQIAVVVGALVGIVLEVTKIATRGRFWLSAVGVGLAFILPFNTSLAMFTGSFIFWLASKLFKNDKGLPHRVMVQNLEPTAAGVIAGGALAGIAVVLVELFVL